MYVWFACRRHFTVVANPKGVSVNTVIQTRELMVWKWEKVLKVVSLISTGSHQVWANVCVSNFYLITFWLHSESVNCSIPLLLNYSTCLSASSRCSLLEVELLSSSSELCISSSSEWTSCLSQPLFAKTARWREDEAEFSFSLQRMLIYVKEKLGRAAEERVCPQKHSLVK